MPFVPRNAWIKVEIVEKSEEKTKGGVLIADTGRPKNARPTRVGRVVAVGSGILTITGRVTAHDLKPGDTVVYYSAEEKYSVYFREGGVEYQFVDQMDVFAVERTDTPTEVPNGQVVSER